MASLKDVHCTLSGSSSRVYAFAPFGAPHHDTLINVVNRTYMCLLRTGVTIVAEVDEKHNPMVFVCKLKNTSIKTKVTNGYARWVRISSRVTIVSDGQNGKLSS